MVRLWCSHSYHSRRMEKRRSKDCTKLIHDRSKYSSKYKILRITQISLTMRKPSSLVASNKYHLAEKESKKKSLNVLLGTTQAIFQMNFN